MGWFPTKFEQDGSLRHGWYFGAACSPSTHYDRRRGGRLGEDIQPLNERLRKDEKTGRASSQERCSIYTYELRFGECKSSM
jgi:hypothetical protein